MNQAPTEHKREALTNSRGAAVGRRGRRMVQAPRATEKKALENE
jgi:hypothetical protein